MFKPLRDKILELAITGKLVPQLDSEPAVEQIGPAPAKDEEPFALPEKWKWVNLDRTGSFSSGYTPSQEQILGQGDIPFFKVAQMNLKGNEKYLRLTPTFLNTPRKIFEAGTIVFPKLGGAILTNKRRILAQKSVVDTNTAGFLPTKDVLSLEYAYAFLSTLDFGQYARGTAVPALDLSKVKKIWLPLPPLAEQQRIVATLKPLLEELDAMERAYTELSGPMYAHFKDLILQKAISGKLVPQLDGEPAVEQIGLAPAKEEEPFALPEKWKWVRLDQVAQYRPSVKADDELEVSFAPLEKLSDGYDNFFCFDLIERWRKVKKGFSRFCNGDVIFAKIHPSFQNRKSAVVTRAHNGIGCGSTEYCVFRCKEPLDNQYLLWFFKSEYFISFGKNTFKGTVGQQRVNLDVITTMLFPLPPLEEQRRIVARIEELFGDVDKLLEWQQFA